MKYVLDFDLAYTASNVSVVLVFKIQPIEVILRADLNRGHYYMHIHVLRINKSDSGISGSNRFRVRVYIH